MKESLKKNTKIITEEMIQEYGYLFCQKCGGNCGGIEVHHIIFRSERPKHPMIHHRNNLLICGDDCHKLLHKEKSLRREIVTERDLRKLFNDRYLR